MIYKLFEFTGTINHGFLTKRSGPLLERRSLNFLLCVVFFVYCFIIIFLAFFRFSVFTFLRQLVTETGWLSSPFKAVLKQLPLDAIQLSSFLSSCLGSCLFWSNSQATFFSGTHIKFQYHVFHTHMLVKCTSTIKQQLWIIAFHRSLILYTRMVDNLRPNKLTELL